MENQRDTVAEIKTRIEGKIARDQIILPTIPDSLVRIRNTINNDNASVNDIAQVLGSDPTLAAKILKVSNSAAFQRNSGKSIDNLQQAVTRMGNKLIQTLTTNHALIQVFAKPKGIAGQWINMVHSHSINVAAQAYALARHYTKLNPDDALLAGLLHNIGYLPLLQDSDDLPEMSDTQHPYWLALRQLNGEIGARLLERWNFPPGIVNSARFHCDLTRDVSATTDMVDIIIVAQLTLGNVPPALQYHELPRLIPAYTKLGVFSPSLILENDALKSDFVKAYEMLAI